MGSPEQWRWTDEEGVQRLLRAEELRVALAEGRLKPSTLVWRRGMGSWLPAASVPELMSEFELLDRTKPRATLGAKSAPTPSIPDPGTGEASQRPANMIDIASLRAQKRAQRTMIGISDSAPPAMQKKSAAGLMIPPAPKLPAIGSSVPASNRPPNIERAPRSTNIDGLWAEGSARRDEDEETVTRVRTTDEEMAKARRARSKKSKRKGSQPPPPPRRNSERAPPQRGSDRAPAAASSSKKSRSGRKASGSRPPPPPRSRRPVRKRDGPTLQSQADSQLAAGAPAESVPVVSAAVDAVLSANLGAGGSSQHPPGASTLVSNSERAPHRQEQDEPETIAGPTVVGGGRASNKPRHVYPTAPLPAVREETGSDDPGGPPFASEPWEIPPAPPAPDFSDIPGAIGGSGQASILTDVPPAQWLGRRLRPPLLLGIGGGALVLLIIAFVVGRASAPEASSDLDKVVKARTGWAAVPLFARSRSSALPVPRPCLMLRAPSRWSAAAERRIPIEIAPTDSKLAVGFARSLTEPRGLLIAPTTGVIESRYTPEEVDSALSRVVPLLGAEGLRYGATSRKQKGVRGASYVAAKKPFVVGFTSTKVVKLDEPGAEPTELWDLTEGENVGALRLRALASRGVALTYRHAGKIWYGSLKSDGGVQQAAAVVAGSGGKVGMPMLASNKQVVSVVFADKAPGQDTPIEVRWARGKPGEALKEAVVVELPEGGPGGDAIAPAIASLSGGRWLLMWTEGRRGNRTLRAQTYDRKYKPIGKALRVSPATGNFGQGTVDVAADNAAVAFLLATRKGYQLWGTVLQCR